MNILLLGPQGSGKGTQAKLLIEKFGFFYFESGAYLRKIAKKNEQVAKIMNSGKLVPDKEMTSYLTAYLDQEGLYDDLIFDGFPRTLEQYNFLKLWLKDKGVKLDIAFVLEISREETLKRLSARRMDPSTGKIYNLITNKPESGVDVSKLIQRDDDMPEAIKKRLEVYNHQTKKLIEELEKYIKVVRVDGTKSIEDIHRQISGIIHMLKKE